MFDRNFKITAESDDTNIQIISVIIGRAIRRLEYLDMHDDLDLNDTKLLFDLKCCQQIINEICCLGGFINAIGGDQFESILASLSCLRWGEEDQILCSYLDHMTVDPSDDDEEFDGDSGVIIDKADTNEGNSLNL